MTTTKSALDTATFLNNAIFTNMTTQTKTVSKTRQVIAATIGNALEWYDFIIYGYMAKLFSDAFFTSDEPHNALLYTLATFGVGFFMRPVGGVLLGIYADRKGRKAALQLIIILTTIAIGLITFAPTYQSVGIAAPIIMVIARLLQGFATGGEFASATAFLMETAPYNRRGLYGSWQFFGQFLALLVGSVVGALVTGIFTDEQVSAWGWRIPFAVGLLIAPVGFWIRRFMEETEEFVHKKEEPMPFLQVLQSYPRALFVVIGCCAASTACTYVLLINVVNFASATLKLPMDKIFLVQIFSAAWMLLVIPVAGFLSDLYGRKIIAFVGFLGTTVPLYPLYLWLIADPSILKLFVTQFILITFIGIAQAPLPTAFAEQFPVQVRATAMAIGYNFAVTIFGGFAPFIVTWMIKVSGNPIAPTWYVLVLMLLGFLAVYFMQDTYEPMSKRSRSSK